MNNECYYVYQHQATPGSNFQASLTVDCYRWTFVVPFVSPYFGDVAWQKLRQCVLIF